VQLHRGIEGGARDRHDLVRRRQLVQRVLPPDHDLHLGGKEREEEQDQDQEKLGCVIRLLRDGHGRREEGSPQQRGLVGVHGDGDGDGDGVEGGVEPGTVNQVRQDGRTRAVEVASGPRAVGEGEG
jgi:hypothetical protein